MMNLSRKENLPMARNKQRRRQPIGLCLLLMIAFAAEIAATNPDKTGKSTARALQLPKSDLTEDEQILNALNRLAFGPRPGEVGRIRRMGLANYLQQQLYPEG